MQSMIEKALIGGLFIAFVYDTDIEYKNHQDGKWAEDIALDQYGDLLNQGFAFVVVFYMYALWLIYAVQLLRSRRAAENETQVKQSEDKLFSYIKMAPQVTRRETSAVVKNSAVKSDNNKSQHMLDESFKTVNLMENSVQVSN